MVQLLVGHRIARHAQFELDHDVTYLDTTLEYSMQGPFPPQALQAPLDEEKAGAHTVPLKHLFEQLESSEQGLTSASVTVMWRQK
jgi:hypothetical protein